AVSTKHRCSHRTMDTAPGDHGAGRSGIWLLHAQRQRHFAGCLRLDGFRGGGAIRPGTDRRLVLARGEPTRRRGRPAAGLRGLGLYPVDADLDRGRLVGRRLDPSWPVWLVVVAPLSTIRIRRMGPADERHLLVFAMQYQRISLGVLAQTSVPGRTFACRTISESVCRAPDVGIQALLRGSVGP